MRVVKEKKKLNKDLTLDFFFFLLTGKHKQDQMHAVEQICQSKSKYSEANYK